MNDIRMECVKRSHSKSRFYELSVTVDLFGAAVLTRRWGKIGAPGKSKREAFPTMAAAQAALQAWRRKKLARGYRELGGGAPPTDRLEAEVERAECDAPPGALSAALSRLASVTRLPRPQRPAPAPARQVRMPWDYDDRDHRILSGIASLPEQVLRRRLLAARGGALPPGAAAVGEIVAGRISLLVPRTLARVLDREVVGTLARERGLEGPALRLHRAGVQCLGQLAQLPFHELMRILNDDREAARRVERRLATLRLAIDSQAPWWRPPAAAGYARALAQTRGMASFR